MCRNGTKGKMAKWAVGLSQASTFKLLPHLRTPNPILPRGSWHFFIWRGHCILAWRRFASWRAGGWGWGAGGLTGELKRFKIRMTHADGSGLSELVRELESGNGIRLLGIMLCASFRCNWMLDRLIQAAWWSGEARKIAHDVTSPWCRMPANTKSPNRRSKLFFCECEKSWRVPSVKLSSFELSCSEFCRSSVSGLNYLGVQ